MARAPLLVGSLLIFAATTSAGAQLSLWFDVRDDISEINNPDPWGFGVGGFINEPHGGGRGDGQVRYVSPKLPNNAHISGQYDPSTASITLYADYAAPPGTVLESLGIDIEVDPPPGNPSEYVLEILTVEVFNTPAEIGGGLVGNAWDTITLTTPPTTIGVGIHVRRTNFGPGLGIPAGQGYRLARLTFQAADRNCQPGQAVHSTTLGVSIRVNVGLVTERSTGGTAPVTLNLGYVNGAPEPANGHGGIAGATSPTPDATVIIQMKQDFDDNATVNTLDVPLHEAARGRSLSGIANVRDAWIGDGNGDGFVNGVDRPHLLASRSVGIQCPTHLAGATTVQGAAVWFEHQSGNGMVLTEGRGRPLTILKSDAPGTYQFGVQVFVDSAGGPGVRSWSLDLMTTATNTVLQTAAHNFLFDINDPIILGTSPGIILDNLGSWNWFAGPKFGVINPAEFTLEVTTLGGEPDVEIFASPGGGVFAPVQLIQFADAAPIAGHAVGTLTDRPVIIIRNAPAGLGDLNCDGQVNVGDVPAFVQALVDATGCDVARGDINGDTRIDGADIHGFVGCVINNGCF